MRKIFLIILIITAGISFAQTKVPDKVKTAFDGKFPNAAVMKWEADDDEYTAEFSKDNLNYYATFDEDGKWIETGVMTAFDNLPDALKKNVKEKYKDNEIKCVYKVEDFKGIISYEVDVIKDGKVAELYFNKDGSEADDD